MSDEDDLIDLRNRLLGEVASCLAALDQHAAFSQQAHADLKSDVSDERMAEIEERMAHYTGVMSEQVRRAVLLMDCLAEVGLPVEDELRQRVDAVKQKLSGMSD